MNVTQLLIYLFYTQSNFSKSTSHIHSKSSHFYCHLTEVVNTFSLSFCLLPGLSPDINPMTTNNYCIGFRVVFYCLLRFQRSNWKNFMAIGMSLDLILKFLECQPIRISLSTPLSPVLHHDTNLKVHALTKIL